MKVSDERLVGWLCFVRWNQSNWCAANVPHEVFKDLMELGWLEQTSHGPILSAEGLKVSDLEAAEWGIDALPEEEVA